MELLFGSNATFALLDLGKSLLFLKFRKLLDVYSWFAFFGLSLLRSCTMSTSSEYEAEMQSFEKGVALPLSILDCRIELGAEPSGYYCY